MANSIEDGELVSVGAGMTRVWFEFDTNNVSQPTTTRVSLQGLDGGTPEIAARLLTRIRDVSAQNVPGRLPVFATQDPPNGGTIVIQAEARGAAGNQLILESVANEDFQVESMDGGHGLDCPIGMGCTENEDCAPFLAIPGRCHIPTGQLTGHCVVP
ncbi:hypothetical protein [Myxococcus stipitatus]|uniref:hypothetical protein n=1 Tax=Myxococcus stipitatus TaxID=83455 RepID=UPI0002E957F6|nr:hypothetical protein [Myxococcus stipitatus]